MVSYERKTGFLLRKVVRYILFLPLFIANLLAQEGQAFGQVPADSTSSEQAKKISGFINVGFSGSNGNVERSSSNYAFELNHLSKRNQITFDGSSYSFTSRGVKLDENSEVSLIDLLRLSDRQRLYAKATFYRNVYRGFDEQWKVGVGYLHSFFKSDKASFSTRTGYQVRESSLTGKLTGDYNEGTHHFALVGFMTNFPLVKNIAFSSKFDLELDFDRRKNYLIGSSSKIDFRVNEWLGFQLNYLYLYVGLPVTGKLPKDQRMDLALKISY